MVPFESAVRGSLERSRDDRALRSAPVRAARRSRQPRYTTIRDATLDQGTQRDRLWRSAAVEGQFADVASHAHRGLPAGEAWACQLGESGLIHSGVDRGWSAAGRGAVCGTQELADPQGRSVASTVSATTLFAGALLSIGLRPPPLRRGIVRVSSDLGLYSAGNRSYDGGK